MILQFLTTFITITGSFGAIYSAYGWWRHRLRTRELDQPITIHLINDEDGGIRHPIAIKLPRRSINRAEALGLIGMLPTHNNQRYSCAYLQRQEFFDQLDAVFEGRSDVLSIRFTDLEFATFALKKP